MQYMYKVLMFVHVLSPNQPAITGVALCDITQITFKLWSGKNVKALFYSMLPDVRKSVFLYPFLSWDAQTRW